MQICLVSILISLFLISCGLSNLQNPKKDSKRSSKSSEKVDETIGDSTADAGTEGQGEFSLVLPELKLPAEVAVVNLTNPDNPKLAYKEKFPYKASEKVTMKDIRVGYYEIKVEIYFGDKVIYVGISKVKINKDEVASAVVQLKDVDTGSGEIAIEILPPKPKPSYKNMCEQLEQVAMICSDIYVPTACNYMIDVCSLDTILRDGVPELSDDAVASSKPPVCMGIPKLYSSSGPNPCTAKLDLARKICKDTGVPFQKIPASLREFEPKCVSADSMLDDPNIDPDVE